VLEQRSFPDYFTSAVVEIRTDRSVVLDNITNLNHVIWGEGQVTINLDATQGRNSLRNLSNYIGDNVADGRSDDGIRLLIRNTDGADMLISVHIQSAGIETLSAASLCFESDCITYASSRNSYGFAIKRSGHLYVKSNSEVAYLVLESIERVQDL
jgi:hypothetical protein